MVYPCDRGEPTRDILSDISKTIPGHPSFSEDFQFNFIGDCFDVTFRPFHFLIIKNIIRPCSIQCHGCFTYKSHSKVDYIEIVVHGVSVGLAEKGGMISFEGLK